MGTAASQSRRGLLASVLIASVVGLSLLLGSVGGLARLFDIGRTEDRYRSNPVVLHALQDLAAYRAATGNFQVVVDLERDVKRIPAFVAGERTVLVAGGSVDAEVDFSDLGAEAVEVSPDRSAVRVTLPPARLTDARIDNDQTYVAGRHRGVLNRIGQALSSSPGDDAALYRRAEADMEAAAASSELAARAEENTRQMLTAFLGSLGFEHIEVVFAPQTLG